MAVTSATLGAAEVQALVGRPRAFVAKGAERRGLVTACLSRSERKGLSDKGRQQGWLPW